MKKRNPMIITAAAFVALSIITHILLEFTKNTARTNYIVFPYLAVCLFLVPFCSVLLGIIILQIIDRFFGIGRPKKSVQKIGWIITLSVLGANLVMVLPYIIWCLSDFFQKVTGNESESAYFPSIPGHGTITSVLLMLISKAPYIYTFAGMALWIFQPSKQERTNEIHI